MRFIHAVGVAAAALVAATPAVAQESDVLTATVNAGPSAGYHDLGVDAPGD